MDAHIEKTLSSLQARHINGIFAEDASEANRKVLSLIPSDATVGIGDSTSMRQLGTLNVLRERGVRILNPFDPRRDDMGIEEYRQERERIRKETSLSDVFLTGTNALTRGRQTGQCGCRRQSGRGDVLGASLYPSSSSDGTKSSETWMKPSTGFAISLPRTILRSERHWGAEKGRPPAS